MHAVFCFREVEGVDTQPVDIVIDMFDASCIFYQDVAGIVVALGNAVLHQFPKRNREILVGKLLPQGAVGIGRHLGCLYGNNAVQTDALLIHLVQYGQCHMEFEYTEQGEVYMVVIPEHVSFVCPYGYTNGGFLAIEQTVNPVSSSDICCARTTVAIQVNKVSMAMKYAFITSISLRGNSHAKIQLLAASC